MKSQAKTNPKKPASKSYNGGVIRVTAWGTYQADVRAGGSRKRKQFETLDEAKAFIDAAVGEGTRIGSETFSKLSPKQAQDAVEALHLLSKAGRTDTLYSIVEEYLNRNRGPGADLTVSEMYEAHMADLKARRRKRTWQDKEIRLRGFVEIFGGMSLSAISFQDVKDWLESTGHSGRSLRNDQIAVQSLFNWIDEHTKQLAREQSNMALHWHNDVAIFPASAWETSDAAEIGTVSNADAVAVLRRLEELDPESALVLALGLLAGLRTAEIVEKDGLLWGNIGWTEREITITAKQSKTKHGREVHINDALLSWLLKYKQESGRIGRRFNAFRKYRSQACQDVGIEWPHNAARHTFASNYCKIHGYRDAADALGHEGGVDILKSNYLGVMQSKVKAEAYFKILTPSGSNKNVIRMEATA
jgi:integrase